MFVIEESDPASPGAAALLRQSHALMESLFPPEDNHYLDIEALRVPHIHFYTVREDDAVLGTGAIANKGTYGEIKSMFVDEAARGKGVADALMRQLEDKARELELPEMMLETGNVLYAAHRLYKRHGFELCGPFGDYEHSPSSIFMRKTL